MTDANMVLGYLDPEFFLGGRLKRYPELARRAIEDKVATPLGLGLEEAAAGIYRLVNQNMADGILEMTMRRGIDPRELTIIVGGGASAIHIAAIARELDMKRIVIPKAAPVLCALGMLSSDVVLGHVASKYTESGRFDVEGVNEVLASLEAKAKEGLDREGIPETGRRFDYFVAARYPGQQREIDMNLRAPRLTSDMIPQLVADFHEIHLGRYTVCDPSSPIECTDWRVVGVGVMPRLNLKELSPVAGDFSPTPKAFRAAYFESLDDFIETPVYDGSQLGLGMSIEGPAIIEDAMTTTVVVPGASVTVDNLGSYCMELD